jgi:hypothetical protein
MAVFCLERKFKLVDEKRNPGKNGKNIIWKRNPKIQGLAVTPSGEGGCNGKKTYMGVGALRGKGRKG